MKMKDNKNIIKLYKINEKLNCLIIFEYQIIKTKIKLK